ncbi:MAG: cysteine peptidase family C39 domain-containing protein, partial [Candidatus Omnitrophota bacterium]
MYKNPESKNQAELKAGHQEKTAFKSSFKAWIRIVAFIVVAIFIPEQVAQAVEYDWRVLWQKPGAFTPYSPILPTDLRQLDIAVAVRNILKDIAGKPINAIKISPTLTINLEKPLNISKQRIEEIYNWLVGKPCGAKALYDFLAYKGIVAQEQDIAVMALTTDILSGILKPEGNPKIIKNSLYALSRASEFFGQKLYPVSLRAPEGRSNLSDISTPFIAHLKNDHYILVTRITDEKVYFADEHKEEFLPKAKFLDKFSGYALVSSLVDSFQLLTDKEAQDIKGAAAEDMADFYDQIETYGDYDGGYYVYPDMSVNSVSEYMPTNYGTPVLPDFSNLSVNNINNVNISYSGISPNEMSAQFTNNLNSALQQNPNADFVIRNDPNMGVVFETYAHTGYGNSINVYNANDNSVISQGFHDNLGNTYHADSGNTFYAKDSSGAIQSTGSQAEMAAGDALERMTSKVAYASPNIPTQNIASNLYGDAMLRAQNGETIAIPNDSGSTVFYKDKGIVKMEIYNDDLRTVSVSQVTDNLTIPLAQGSWDNNNVYTMHDIGGGSGNAYATPNPQTQISNSVLSQNVPVNLSGGEIFNNGQIAVKVEGGSVLAKRSEDSEWNPLAIRGRGNNPLTLLWDAVAGTGKSGQLYIDGSGSNNTYLTAEQQTSVENILGLKNRDYDMSWGTGLTSGLAGQAFDNTGYYSFVAKDQISPFLSRTLPSAQGYSGGNAWVSPQELIALKSTYGQSGLIAIGKDASNLSDRLAGFWGLNINHNNGDYSRAFTTEDSVVAVSGGNWALFGALNYANSYNHATNEFLQGKFLDPPGYFTARSLASGGNEKPMYNYKPAYYTLSNVNGLTAIGNIG